MNLFNKVKALLFIFLLLSITSCSGWKESERKKAALANEACDPIYRQSNEKFYVLQTPRQIPRTAYPWEKQMTGNLPRITKEYFRCRGSNANLPYVHRQGERGESLLIDCEGGLRHQLPLLNQKEHVPEIFIELLNYVQEKTGKRVHITCGHRCSRHNSYADPRKDNYSSKHLTGHEVDFYVEGMEKNPQQVVKIIESYYASKGKKELTTFQRWQKPVNVATQPWYNKEIFIKLYLVNEGRDRDNAHGYPYLSIQLRS